MYIRECKVKNFMIHQDTEVKFGPLTLFVGPNGGGKSALFEALLNFSMLARGNIQQAFGGFPYSYGATKYHGARGTGRIGFRMTMSEFADDPEWLEYEIDYSQLQVSAPGARPIFTIHHELLTKKPSNEVLFDRSHLNGHPYADYCSPEEDRSIFSSIRGEILSGRSGGPDPLVLHCVTQISKFNKFRLNPTQLAYPSRFPETTSSEPITLPRIGYEGEDLASTLYYLSNTGNTALQTIIEKIKIIDRDFEQFDFNSVSNDRVGFSAVYSDVRGSIPASRLSSGMLSFIGLITLVCSPSRPSVLMIEEPENGLSPQAARLFYSTVRAIANDANISERSQVLLSSHSPSIICETWSTGDIDHLYQVKVTNGKSGIKKFSDVISDNGVMLPKDADGKRTILSLKNSEEVMSGYLS